jgi:hypothetical protein
MIVGSPGQQTAGRQIAKAKTDLTEASRLDLAEAVVPVAKQLERWGEW